LELCREKLCSLQTFIVLVSGNTLVVREGATAMPSMLFSFAGLAAGLVGAQCALAQNIQSPSPNVPPAPPQTSPSTGERPSGPRAPIGHRQPTPKDLPPQEQSGTPSVPEIAQPPSICRNR
jgi:hypothetical protein